MIKYGKSNAEYMRLKSEFYDLEQNRRWTDLAGKVARKYMAQPRREACVACEERLDKPLFVFREVEYSVCGRCGHFNGVHEDTLEFAEYLYKESVEGETLEVYSDHDLEAYRQRVASIYAPKAEFMREAIAEQGVDPNSLTYADLGAGSGHFVMAMRECGLTNAIGYDATPKLVERTNRMHDSEVLRHNEIDELNDLAATAEVDVITMIFALEHIRGLREFLAALKSNPRVKYFFFAVPVFNPSVFLEVVAPEVMPRILGLGHTHLFTDKSIELLCRDFGMTRPAEWWVGANAFDIHRTVSVQLQSLSASAEAPRVWNEMLSPMIDALQLVFDHQKLSSEVHLLASFER